MNLLKKFKSTIIGITLTYTIYILHSTGQINSNEIHNNFVNQRFSEKKRFCIRNFPKYCDPKVASFHATKNIIFPITSLKLKQALYCSKIIWSRAGKK